MTGRTNAHGCVWFHHNSGGTGLAGTVDHVRHEVQTWLEQQTVITGKQFLIHQLLYLEDEDRQREMILYKVRKYFPSNSTQTQNIYTSTRSLSYLQRYGQGVTFGLRAIKALNVAVPYLDLEVFSHAGLAVDMLAIFKAEAVGAQLLHKADTTAEHLAVKHLLPLCLVKVQELR